MTFTAEEKYRAAMREVGQRKKVYPNIVVRGNMTQEEARYQIDVMEAIAADYEEQAKKERML